MRKDLRTRTELQRCGATSPRIIDSFKALEIVGNLVGSNNFLSFDRIAHFTGLSIAEIIQLKFALEEELGVSVTSRVDLDPAGFFFGD